MDRNILVHLYTEESAPVALIFANSLLCNYVLCVFNPSEDPFKFQMFPYLSLYYLGECQRDKNHRILLEDKNAKASKYEENQHVVLTVACEYVMCCLYFMSVFFFLI